ncbi:glycosyltransferase family 9 protein [bacterium]|nr:glycosyltransferase family 9 protein [bacterium]
MRRPVAASEPPRSIVVAQLAFIGDMVFATPLLDEIRGRWPDAALAVVGRPAALEVLLDHPANPELIAYDKGGRDRGAVGLLRVARAVRARRPDVFLGVTRSGRTALLARLSGAPCRVGFRGPARGACYDHLVPRDDGHRRFPERPTALLSPFGPLPAPRPMSLAVGAVRRAAAAEALAAAGWRGEPLLAIAPGAHYATKRWPERHVEALLDLAAADGFAPALYGGPEETALVERLLAGRPRALDRRGVGIRGVAAELSLAAAFVGGDSGPAHIARALGTPAVVLHGPTDPTPLADGRPYVVLTVDLDCRPCSPHGDAVCPRGHHRCLEEIAPERVLAAVRAAARGA